jgi:hypothetical protein
MRSHNPIPDGMTPEQPFSDYVFECVSQWADTPAFTNGPSGRALAFAGVARAAMMMTSSMLERGLRIGEGARDGCLARGGRGHVVHHIAPGIRTPA